MQRTMVFLKPDAIHRGLVGEALSKLEKRGLKLVALKMLRISEELADKHYAAHKGKPFFDKLISYVTAGPIVAAVLEGTAAVEVVRSTIGATNPAKAAAGTIRGDFGLSVDNNLIHGSDSEESAEREISLFFLPEEIVHYIRDHERWITEF